MARRLSVTLAFFGHVLRDLLGTLAARMRRQYRRVVLGDETLAVGVDIFPFFERMTGVGWYEWNLLARLPHVDPAIELRLYAQTFAAPDEPPPPQLPTTLRTRFRFHHIPDGFMLPAQISTPAGFDSTKKYPVIIYVYGGPGSPSVSDEWNSNGWAEPVYFEQVLLRSGFIVFSVDNRSSASVGKVFEKAIRGQMYGDVELNDLMTAVHWLKSRSYVDTSRVGIWGWSGGGTYALLAMTRSKEFRAGIAVAPVTDWRYYDAKWAELPMKRPEENPSGYAKTSLVSRARDLHGRLLMVHGTGDDNVHPQNSQAFMNELIKEGILFDVMIYPMRKHTIDDPPARKHLFKTMLEFWEKNLSTVTPESGASGAAGAVIVDPACSTVSRPCGKAPREKHPP